MDEEDSVRPKGWQPKNLEPLSIEQLEDYIAVLRGEIARTEADIASKKAHMNNAEAFFKK